MPKTKILLCVVGPTAVGKSSTAIYIANALKCDIISADARQVYKEMSIGTAKPSENDLAQAKHHFVNSHNINDTFNAGVFEKQAVECITSLHTNNNYVVMAGGSGLYVDAVCKGLDDFIEIPPQIRADLNEQFNKKGLIYIREELKQHDPKYFSEADIDNPKRIMRALEVCYTTGKPYSSFKTNKPKDRAFKTFKIGLTLDRAELYERINLRVDEMIKNGLVDEAMQLHAHKNLNALQTVGYQELFEHFDGKITQLEAIDKIKRNSRRYAKRQMTWFRKDESIKWFSPKAKDEIMDYINSLDV